MLKRAALICIGATVAAFALLLAVLPVPRSASAAIGAPPTSTSAVNANWSHVSLPLDECGTADPGRLTGIAVVAPMQPGRSDFELDGLQLVR